jgi:EmrB/QacA subfamily drug resistance transporter
VIAFIVSLSFFMEAVDSTVINTAIPAMSRSLMVEPVDLKVALISYLLSLAIFIPISGWLADKCGSKKIFIAALTIFTLSSLWCGFAESLPMLVIARFFQGLGGALGLPVGRLIIIRTFGREKLISKMNYVVTVGALGIMLGPVIGGFITHYFSWHWIFWVNIPVGLLGIVLAIYWLPSAKPEGVKPLDKWGFVFFGLSLAGFTFGLSALSETSVKSSVALSILIGSIFLIFVYWLHSRKVKHPIVKVDLLKLRTFQVSMIGNLISRLGFGGVPFLVPLLLQIGLGYSAESSGLIMAPTALGILLGKPLALPLLRIFGYKWLLIINTLFAGLSIWVFVIVNALTPIYLIGMLTFLYGFMLSMQYTSMNSLGYADVAPEDLSAATSMMSTLQQLAQSFGVAVSALFIRLFSQIFSDNLILTPLIFHYTFFAIGFFTILSSLIFIKLKKTDGEQMIHG